MVVRQCICNFFTKDIGVKRDLGNRAILVTGLMKKQALCVLLYTEEFNRNPSGRNVIEKSAVMVACVASVSLGFCSKRGTRTKNFLAPNGETQQKRSLRRLHSPEVSVFPGLFGRVTLGTN